MSIKAVEKWIERLPDQELNRPLVVLEDRAFTPNEVLENVKAGTDNADQLQQKVESGDIATPEDLEEELAREGIKDLLEERPIDVVRLTRPNQPPEKSAEEIKEELDEDTEFAKDLIQSEKEYIDRLKEV